MTYINQYDKRTGTTYVYGSESYWDKEKQQPRSKRKLIGKLDEKTGVIIPTDGRGKKRTEKKKAVSDDTALCEELKLKLKEKELQIHHLTEKNKTLEKEQTAILKAINDVLYKYEKDNLHQ
jgi:lysophospholipid acyltransferase (LPLAT)-like uncharacterized protein